MHRAGVARFFEHDLPELHSYTTGLKRDHTAVLAGLTVVTVAQRIWHVRGQLAGKESVAAEVTEVVQEGTST